MKDIANISSAFLTPLIAVVATYIAFRQYKTHWLKLKLDLYEKRFAVFETVLSFIGLLATWQKPTAQDMVKLDEAKITSFFLFGEEVPKYIQTLRDKAVEINLLSSERREIAGLADGQMSAKLREEQTIVVDWFEKQYTQCRSVFERYLAVRT